MYDKSSFGNSTYRFESMLTIDAKTLPVKGIITNRFYDKKQEGTNQVVRTCHFPYSEAMPIKYFFSDPYEIKIYEDSEPTMANSEIDPSKDKLILDATIHFHLHIE